MKKLVALVLCLMLALGCMSFASAEFAPVSKDELKVGFVFIGRSFGVKTVYVSVLSSAGLSLLESFCPLSAPLTSQPVLELIFAILLPATSAANS